MQGDLRPAANQMLGGTRGDMYTARCTLKVLEALHLPVVAQDQPPSTALGDWYVNFINMRTHRLVHFVSDRSLLSVVVPVKTLKTALDRHIVSLHDLLEDLGVPPAIIQAELVEMSERAVAKTNSRSVLASMRDLALNTRWILEKSPHASPVEFPANLHKFLRATSRPFQQMLRWACS